MLTFIRYMQLTTLVLTLLFNLKHHEPDLIKIIIAPRV